MRHILEPFDAAMRSLRESVLKMAVLAEQALKDAGDAIFDRDNTACERILAGDAAIDELEMRVDRDGVDCMVRFQPMARDLRLVVSAMKTGGNLERIGDQAVGIARRARNLNLAPLLPETASLECMFRAAFGIFRDSVRSYAEGDEELARSLKQRDRELDLLHHRLIAGLTERMSEDPARIADYLDLIFIARFIERIGDHSVNVAEDAVFAVAAEDIRHAIRLAAAG